MKGNIKNVTVKNYRNAAVKQGSTIYFDLNSKSTRSGLRPPVIGLAHELGHADDFSLYPQIGLIHEGIGQIVECYSSKAKI